MRRLLLFALTLLALWPRQALSAEADLYCATGPAGVGVWQPCGTSGNPVNIAGSFTATLSGWPGSTQTTGTPIAVTTGGVTGSLPSGAVVLATNIDPNGTGIIAYCKLGASATTSDAPIFAKSSVSFTVGNATQLTCITSTSTTTVNTSGGAGLPTGWGGGGSGGGGGGAVTIASGAVASGAYSSGSIASGAIASGAVASGAIASGALAAGAGTDGWDATQGAKADSACGSDNGTCSMAALLKRNNQNITTLNTTAGSSVAAGTNLIGYTTPDPCTQAAKTNLAISFQTTSITQLIALSGSTKIYVCSLSLIASAATVFSVTGGTGTNCGTPAALIGTTSATHGLSLAANGGLTLGNGLGTVAVTGAGSELCIVQTGAGDIVGNLTYVQQ